MLGSKPAVPLTPAATALVSRTVVNPVALRNALQAVDQAFESEQPGRVLNAIRAAVEECRQIAPDLLDRVRQHVSVRCALAGIDKQKTLAALGGASHHDAYFCRLFARGMEAQGDPESLAVAGGTWNDFRESTVREGWFAANGVEAATLYLHIASLLGKIPGVILSELRRTWKKVEREELYFLFPEKLYERAAALDPHTEAFAQWLDWAKSGPQPQAEQIAQAWHRILPTDIEPVLYLMRSTEARGAYPTALGYLADAERIDGVHPAVRRARLRLMAGSITRHIQQKKPHLAEQKLALLSALPQAQPGDRPALVSAFRYVLNASRGRSEQANLDRSELERALESRVAAEILIFSLAAACKQPGLARLSPAEKLTSAERGEFPAAVARMTALAADLGIGMRISENWMEEAARQFPNRRRALDTGQVRTLAEAGLCAGAAKLAYAASAEGLERGGATEARFLFLRARSLPEDQSRRTAACAAAAAEMARRQRDMELVEGAVDLLGKNPDYRDASLTFDQAAEVLRREKAARAFPSRENSALAYAYLIPDPLCQCPECRRERGETGDDADTDDFLDGIEIPPDMPPEIASMLFEEVRHAVARGESIDEFLDRMIGGRGPGRRRKRRRR